MTKKEKIAITTGAIAGFIIFCLLLFLVVVPFLNHISYLFDDGLKVRAVAYDDLAYAMGDEFVFISDDAFDDDFCFIKTAEIDYFGKWSDFSETKSIKGAKRYYFNVSAKISEGVCYRIRFSCEKWQDGDYGREYDYGNAKYFVNDHIYDAVVIVGKIAGDKGEQNKLSAVFTVEYRDKRLTNPSAPNPEQCQEIFESMLDNVVGYSQFNALNQA